MSLHPQSRAFLDAAAAARAPQWYERELSDAREVFDTLPFFGQPSEVAEVLDADLAGVPVRIYRPSTCTQTSGVIVYFHGGGWVLGSIASHDVLCRRLANQSGAAVVSVDYRRPPEDPFPAAPEDCFTACDVLSMDHRRFGIGGPMIVAGDSAGGNLAAAVCQMSLQRGGPKISGQVLIYPVLDGSMSGRSYRDYADGYGLTSKTMAWFWQCYTGDSDSSGRSNPLASISRQTDLSGLPPTHVITAEYDVLRSEIDDYETRLRKAGVKVSAKQYNGMLHGFIHFSEPFDESAVAIADIASISRKFLDIVASD
jgi:acetyl esterase